MNLRPRVRLVSFFALVSILAARPAPAIDCTTPQSGEATKEKIFGIFYRQKKAPKPVVVAPGEKPVLQAGRDAYEGTKNALADWLLERGKSVDPKSQEAYGDGFLDAATSHLTGAETPKNPHLGDAAYARGFGEYHAATYEPVSNFGEKLVQEVESLAVSIRKGERDASAVARRIEEAQGQVDWLKKSDSFRDLTRRGFKVEKDGDDFVLKFDVYGHHRQIRGLALGSADRVESIPLTSGQAQPWLELLAEREKHLAEGTKSYVSYYEAKLAQLAPELVRAADLHLKGAKLANQTLIAAHRAPEIVKLLKKSPASLTLDETSRLLEFVRVNYGR